MYPPRSEVIFVFSESKYTETHEWVHNVNGNKVRVGITDHAQKELGDVVYVELPEIGRELKAGSPFGVVESVKAVSDLVSPVSGKVVEVNATLKDKPELVNQSAHQDAWMVVVELPDIGELAKLLTPDAYEQFVARSAGKH